MFRSVVFLALCLLVTASAPVLAAKHAFVVGIDQYDNLHADAQLERARNDARAMAASFDRLGFRTALHENLTRRGFNAAWASFLERVQPSDEVAIFYAGHGIEIDGQNFFLPRDIPNVRYGREAQVKRESLSLPEMLADLRERHPRVSLVIIDACREHPLLQPLGTRSIAGGPAGLAVNTAPPRGTFIMYSAGAGETALDRLPAGDNDPLNSVYTRHLLPLLETPGLSLSQVAKRVRVKVDRIARSVPHAQTPAYYDNMLGTYCLAGCAGANTAAAKEPSQDKANNRLASLTRPLATTGARNTQSQTSQNGLACQRIGRSLPQALKLRVGMKFCDASNANTATVIRIANRRVVFDDNGIKRLTCRQGQLCAFDWPVKPLFRITAQADAARGILPSAQMLPRR